MRKINELFELSKRILQLEMKCSKKKDNYYLNNSYFNALKFRKKLYIFREIIIKFIWIFVSALSILEINIQDEEVKYEVSPLEICFMIFTTLGLLTGLKKNKIEYLAPWVAISVWNIFEQKYFALEFILFSYYYVKYGFLVYIIGIIILSLKLVLWVKIVGLVLKETMELV